MQAPVSYSLEPYKGPLAEKDLLHLLRRTLFGVSVSNLAFFKGKTIEQAMNILLKPSAPAPPPLQDDPDRNDPLVPKGKLWINAPYEDEFVDKSRRDALKGWIAGQMLMRDLSVTEKMKLFWRNHFVTETDVVRDARYSYTYSQLLHKHALGNFKNLIIEGTTNPAMLVYLNGNTNNKNAPNENYARELLELFTIGKGYAQNYTEQDVRTAARILTGYTDNKQTITGDFNPHLHDFGKKQFSEFFNHATIQGKSGNQGTEELQELTNIIFSKKETALFFCRNLYRWLVYQQIDEQTEKQIIEPLAQIFAKHQFEILPVLKTLLSSQHFFDPAFRGCLVKSPVDFYIGAALQFNLEFPENESERFLTHIYFYFTMLSMLMGVADPPSVSGWPAYYQPPKYGLWWINSHTLGQRKAITDGLASTTGTASNGPVLKFNFVNFVSQLPHPHDIDHLLTDCLHLLCALEVNSLTKNSLKELLLAREIKNGSQWTQHWNAYRENPNSPSKTILETTLRPFFQKLLILPEYQMM